MEKIQLEELLKSIGEMMDKKLSAYDSKRKEEEEEAKKKADEDAKKKAIESDSLKSAEEEVRKRKAEKNQADMEKERFLEAVKWNAGLKEFLANNAEYLPENLADIINVLEAKTYTDDVEKAQELKRAVVEQYIKHQENIEILPDSLKAKAEKYAGFTTKEKLETAPEYYDIVETGIHTAKNIKKAEAIEKGGNFGIGEKSAAQEYEEKMLNFSKETINNNIASGDNK